MTGAPTCNECGEPAGGESYSLELRRWRWWCRPCLVAHRARPTEVDGQLSLEP